MDAPSTRPSGPDPVGPDPVLRPWLDRVDRFVRQVALWGGGMMLLGLMLLTAVDVVLRYGFNAPIYGARDVAKLMLLVLVAASVAFSARTGGQVAIEFFSQWMGPRSSRWREVGVRVTAFMMLLILVWQLWISGNQASRFGETSLALSIAHGPFYYLLAAGMGLYALVLAVEIPLVWRQGALDYHADPEADRS